MRPRNSNRIAHSQFFLPVGIGVFSGLLGVSVVTAVTVLSSGNFASSTSVAATPVASSSVPHATKSPAITNAASDFEHEIPQGTSDSTDTNAANNQPHASQPDDAATASTETGQNPADTDAEPDTNSTFSAAKPNAAATAEPSGTIESSATEQPTVASTQAPATPPAAANTSSLLANIRARSNLIPLAGDGVTGNHIDLASLQVPNTGIKLELLDGEFDDAVETVVTLTKSVPGESGSAQPVETEPVEWTVTQKPKNGLGRRETLGRFRFANGTLEFDWQPQASRQFLPFCRLRISVESESGKESEMCVLFRPFHARPVPLKTEKTEGLIDLLPTTVPVPVSDGTRIQLDFSGVDGATPTTCNVLRSSPGTVTVTDSTTTQDLYSFVSSADFITGGGLRLKYSLRATYDEIRVRGYRIQNKTVTKPICMPQAKRSFLHSQKQQADLQRRIDRALDPQIAKLNEMSGQASYAQATAIEKKLEVLKKQRDDLEDAISAFSDLGSWAELTEKALTTAEANGKLKIRVYRETRSGMKIDILLAN